MLPARIIRSRRKSIAIEIRPDGQVWVRVPQRTPQLIIERVLAEKSAWIEARLQEARAHAQAQAPHHYAPGETFPFLGQPCVLRYVSGSKRAAMRNQEILLPEASRPAAAAALEKLFRSEARAYLTQRVDALAQVTGLAPSKLRISGARTRWGSCSSTGTLSFTWRLIMAPPAVIDYVVLHELAHLRIHNHSRAFWQLVAAWQPDYRALRDWLKREGRTLRIE